MFGFSHTRLMIRLQATYDPKCWQSYLNCRNSAWLVWEVVGDRTSKIGLSKMFKTSHLRFWLANRSYHQSVVLYHQSWTIDCQISCFWSCNWCYPPTIGRDTSRRTSLWLNMHLCTTCADWLHDLRQLIHDPTRSSAIVWYTATGRQTNRCMRSKFCISPNIHDRLYVLQIYRNRTNQKIVWSGVTKV